MFQPIRMIMCKNAKLIIKVLNKISDFLCLFLVKGGTGESISASSVRNVHSEINDTYQKRPERIC